MKNKDVLYLNKDFSQFRDNLIEFVKTYYRDQITDFTPNDPAMMFLDMSAYVGDVLSFYIDKQLQESFLLYAQDRKNIFALAQSLGYKPVPKTPSVASLDVYQLIPSTGVGSNVQPDWNYALKIKSGMQVSTTGASNVIFRTKDSIDFSLDTLMSPRTVSVYQIDGNGVPTYYLVKKTVTIESGKINTETVTIGASERYKKISLNSNEIIQIISIVDSDGNIWYEVPYLSQSTILKSYDNTSAINPNSSTDYEYSPYILSWTEVPKRFITRYKSDYTMEIQFGGGLEDRSSPIELVPNPYNIGLTTPFGKTAINDFFDQTVFISNDSYGEVPSNTELTIKYITGGGVDSNVGSNSITVLDLVEYDINETGLDQTVLNAAKNSLGVNNPEPARGGRDEMELDEIRQNAIASFVSQYRAVTREDYIVRALSMPAKFGSISKVFVMRTDETKKASLPTISNEPNSVSMETPDMFIKLYQSIGQGAPKDLIIQRVKELENFYKLNKKKDSEEFEKLRTDALKLSDQAKRSGNNTIDMYVLSYDNEKRLAETNNIVKQNLKKYLQGFKMLTDTVNIVNAFVVNITVDFIITVLPDYNSNEVLLNCISNLKSYFNIDNWNINQPIIKTDMIRLLANIPGVQSVIDVEINEGNIVNDNVHAVYKLKEAYDKDKQIWYPSLDPMIFEVRNLDQDIKGKVISY